MKSEEEKIKKAAYMREWSRKNPDKVKFSKKKTYWKNKEADNARSKAWRVKNKDIKSQKDKEYRAINKDKVAINKKMYYEKNRDRLIKANSERTTRRRRTDPLYNLKSSLRSRIVMHLINNQYKKSKKTEELLGAEVSVVKEYIEKKFRPGMTWDNHGLGDEKWHIDHIMPLAIAKTEEEAIKLFHYTNLQPLWQKENLGKGSKVLEIN